MAVGNDDMVEEVDAHQFAGSLDASRQIIVALAGFKVARRVVMANGKDGAIGENGFLHHDADIDGGLSDAPMRYF